MYIYIFLYFECRISIKSGLPIEKIKYHLYFVSQIICYKQILLHVGSVLVIEKDGTVVDDNEVLKFCSSEILMLL